MATAAPPANEVAEAPPVKVGGKKKLLIMIGAAVLLLLVAGGAGGFYFWQQKKAAAAQAEAGDEGAADVEEAKPKKSHDKKAGAPVFLPLDLFTVNLADREAERYAQVGITLEVADSKTSDQLKAYMPAIRNDILMLLAHKKAEELQERDGKLALAREIKRAAAKPLQSDDGKRDDGHDSEDDEPVRAVHFSAFIIQ